ncbi:MAG: hypothetical protein M3R17_00175 [Bacteroidota bacterium]|nr:hypothetical protein [Bacteroidota bacterium]
MSSSYFIFCDDENKESFTFPGGLSFFFEQYGGFDNQSEVAQLSVLLQIDLSVFQQYDVPESDEVTWHEISVVKNKMEEFIAKLKSAPSVFQSIKYGSESSQFPNELMQAGQARDVKRLQELIRQMQNDPQATYPLNRGYIESGNLINDLTALDAKLKESEQDGVKKIKFLYM